MTKKPSYRFEGYTESWEEKKFGQLIRSIQTGTTLLGNEQNNGIPLLKMGNIQRGYWDLAKIERLEQEIESENIIRYGDFIFNTRNTLELVGKGATWVLKNGIYGFNSNLARVIFDGVDTIFFNYLYNIPNSISQVKARAVGTTSVAAVYPRDLYSINFSLPSLPEQTAIGSFFQDIDQLISLQQRKLEMLKEQKKTYLKLLFPAKGQTKPALRFAGFEDEWKEVKLGDFVEISKGIQRNKEFLSPNADSKNCYPVYNGGKQESGYTDEFNREGNIMISEGGASAGFVNYFDGKYWSGGHNFTIDELENDINYVLALLESQQQELYSLQVGSGLPNIQLNSLKKVIITFPAFLEQQAIGSFFQDLDKAIAKQEEKVNQLKESKQTLLRKMFI